MRCDAGSNCNTTIIIIVQLVTFPGSFRLQLLCLRITVTIDHPLHLTAQPIPSPLPFAALGRYKSEAGLKGLDDIECTSAYPTAHGELRFDLCIT